MCNYITSVILFLLDFTWKCK